MDPSLLGASHLQEATPLVPCGQDKVTSVPGLVHLQDRARIFLGGHIDRPDIESLCGEREGGICGLCDPGGRVLSIIRTLESWFLSEVYTSFAVSFRPWTSGDVTLLAICT